MKQKWFFGLAFAAGLLAFSFASAQLTIPGYSTTTPSSTTASSTAPSSNGSATAPPCDPNSPSTLCGLQFPTTGLQMQYQDTGSQLQPGPRVVWVDDGSTPLKSAVTYYITENSIKIPMFTSKVFLSYHNKWEEVQGVTQDELDQYPSAQYINLKGSSKIYFINGKTKQFVPQAIADEVGITPDQVIEVNKTDFNSYKTGKNVASADEIQQ